MPALLFLLVLDTRWRKLRIACALLMFTMIIVVGSIPGARADIGQYATGIVLHSIAYAIIAFLLFTGTTGSHALRALKSVLTVAAMGAIDETVQSFFPYRHGAVSDWLVDCTAAALTCMLLWIILPAAAPASEIH
jgi:hypothetical protein